MKTKHKIALARLAQFSVRLSYWIASRSLEGDYTRRGLNWRLDLAEGIDFAIFLLGCFEPETVRFYEKHVSAGDLVFDVGANIGAHTLPLARCAGPAGAVYAFEPTDFAFRKLESNVGLNPQLKSSISTHQMFLGRPEQFVPQTIHSSWPLTSGEEELHPKHLGALKSTSGASATTLDEFCEQRQISRLDWIKLDVDGYEPDVLAGAARTLREFRPNMIMEVVPHEFDADQFASMLEYLAQLDYTMYRIDSGAALPRDPERIRTMVADGASINAYLKRPDSWRRHETL